MKKLLIIISAAVLVLGVIFLGSKSNTSGSDSSNNIQSVEQESKTLSMEIESVNGQIIDVREPEEYIDNHIDKAINIPLGDILSGDFSKIESKKPIYVYCRSGARAEQAKLVLEKSGYENVTNLGGLNNWIAKKGETCSTNSPSCS